jgi:hypothetical protein
VLQRFSVKQKIRIKKGYQEVSMGECFLIFSISSFCLCFGLLLGMCESVRMRNTLHEVGARKSSICYDAVVRRKEKKEKT